MSCFKETALPNNVSNEKNSLNKYISHLLRFAVAGIALYLAFRGQSLPDIGKVFLSLDLWALAAAVTLYFLGQFVFVLRWSLLLITQKIYINYWQALRLHFLGLFYNNCMPGAIGGDLLRAWYVTSHTEKKLEAALSVFFDRAIGLTCTVLIVCLAYFFVPVGTDGGKLEIGADFHIAEKLAQYKSVFIGAALCCAVILIVLCVLKKTRLLLIKLIKFIKVHGLTIFKKIAASIRIYCCKPLILLVALCLSIICQIMAITSIWIIGRNLGITAPIKYYFMFFPLSWILGSLPISVGGAGVMELGLRGMFSRVTTVTNTQGLILGLAQRVILLLSSLPGLVVHITGKHLPKKKELEKNT